jgi:aryl-alcohol dehydrogenase-like predicted oxidoreductase
LGFPTSTSSNCAARRPRLPLLLYSLSIRWYTARSKTKFCLTAGEKALESSSIPQWLPVSFTEPNLSRNLALVERLPLREIGGRHNRSAGEVAIAWTLHHPAVTGAIVGARNARQAEGVMRAGELRLTEEEVNEIETFFAETAA